MFCPNCGKEIPEGKFCLYCGAPVDAPASNPSDQQPGDYIVHIHDADVNVSLLMRKELASIQNSKGPAFDRSNAAFAVKALLRNSYHLKNSEIDKILKKALSSIPIPVDNTAHCPRCGSTSLSANKQGFGVGKAAVGAVLAGPIGLLAGGVGAKKVEVTCLNCGYRFKP